MEEHLGSAAPITSSGAQSEIGCAPQELYKVDGLAAMSVTARYTCAANTMDPVTLEDRMAQAFINVGEM